MARTAVEAFSESADAYAATMAPALRPVAAEVVRRAQLEPGWSVLDIGTGTGIGAAAALGHNRRVIGLDAAPGMLAIARREVPGASFVASDYMALPFADETFDALIAVHALLFASDPVAALAEWRRVAKVGAGIALSVPGPREATAAPIFEPIHRRFGIQGGRTYPDAGRLADMARAAGWSEVETAADPSVAISLEGADDFDRWLATGSRGQATGEWDAERQHALRDAMLAATPRDANGRLRIPFGALYLTARNTGRVSAS
jgi:SAM-dependent methyltransferase